MCSGMEGLKPLHGIFICTLFSILILVASVHFDGVTLDSHLCRLAAANDVSARAYGGNGQTHRNEGAKTNEDKRRRRARRAISRAITAGLKACTTSTSDRRS